MTSFKVIILPSIKINWQRFVKIHERNKTMKKILITGATGNVGAAVIKNLKLKSGNFEIIAGLKNEQDKHDLLLGHNSRTVHFDFFDNSSIDNALMDCNILFLLRPPQISNVKKYFAPIIRNAVERKIEHIVFLSVQGVETSSMIPHHKIEKLIVQSGINYTFLRPAYFMQNFNTTLQKDLVEKDLIFLPAGSAKFTLIDVEDVGAVAAKILTAPYEHVNKAYELTNEELLSFDEIANTLSQGLDRRISYRNPNLLSFYIKKRAEGLTSTFILVMIMLHYLPRFKRTPKKSNWVELLLGRRAISFAEYVNNNKHLLEPPH